MRFIQLVYSADFCANDRMLDIPAFWYGRYGSIPESDEVTQVTINSPQMQPCTACHGATGSVNSLHPNDIQTSITAF